MNLSISHLKYKIAIADDHPLLANAIKNLLETDGPFLVDIVAHNGQDLINKLESAIEIDAILIDISMPILNGIETTKLIREKWSKIIIIALTMFTDNKTKQRFIGNGGDLFLCKDIDPKEFIESLKNIIIKRQSSVIEDSR